MTQIKLYGFLPCPYAQRVRFALEHLKIPYEYVEIDLLKNNQKEQSYLEIHPFGKVPALTFNNETIYESLAILEFFENEFGGVFPKDNIRKTQQRIWINYFEQNVVSKIPNIFTLYKTNDQDGFKKLANDIAENIRFFTKHTKLSEKIRKNPNTYFEGNELTYADFAITPFIKVLHIFYELIYKQPFFELIENDQLIIDFKTYFLNVVASPAYKSITDNLKQFPARGVNSILDTLTFTPETFDYNVFYETYIKLKFA